MFFNNPLFGAEAGRAVRTRASPPHERGHVELAKEGAWGPWARWHPLGLRAWHPFLPPLDALAQWVYRGAGAIQGHGLQPATYLNLTLSAKP